MKRMGWMGLACGLLSAGMAVALHAQEYGAGQQQMASTLTSAVKGKCACGTHPLAKPQDRTVTPYAGEPADLSPYAKFAAPYDLNYIHPNIYSGAGRELPEPVGLKEVRIGFFGPIEHNPEQVFGLRMLHGAQLAMEEANARGGYNGLPYTLMLHNDYDNWQAKTVYGEDRPTDPTIWGSASNEAVKMVYDDKDWAIFGSISSESTHIALRVALRAEIPIVNSASTDPTIPETYIPWYFTTLQDDRVQCLTLARRMFTELGLKRVAILRVNSRYGRFGVLKLRDAARRLGHPIVIEQKYLPGDKDFTHPLQVIRSSRADAIVLWADQEQAAGILKQIQAMGMKQRVFGSYRTIGEELLTRAGSAAEGFEAVFPYDPTRNDPKWTDFNKRYEERFHEKPEQFAALAYDTMTALLQSICRAGLNRARIHDALAEMEEFDGVTGHMVFDPNQKNVAPMYLGTVHNGAITYRVATMEKEAAPGAEQKSGNDAPAAGKPVPYADLGAEKVEYHGAHPADAPAGPLKVVVFGPDAAAQVQSAAMKRVLEEAASQHQAIQLLPIESRQNWGSASTQLVRDLMEEHAIAVLALDRDAGHLAEQLALKSFIPVLALCNDKTLTATNIPWIFRLPAGTAVNAGLRTLAAAAALSGPNPERLRNVLASGDSLAGMAFQSNGEPRANALAFSR
jgi:branched-chain amino acid transport system substrate-binding protein